MICISKSQCLYYFYVFERGLPMMQTKPALATSSTSIFENGNFQLRRFKVEKSGAAPKPLFIVSPIEEGKYPVFLFFHGCCITNTSYTQLLHHIASHGFIAIAPGDLGVCSLFQCFCGNKEVQSAAAVADWLQDGLPTVLPEKVTPDTSKVAVGGHSRGGKIALALALGQAETILKFSAVFGVDPVAGTSPTNRPDPKILSYIPRSFDLKIPVAVIGSGLGSESKCLIPPFAPNGTNHAEFFNESKPPVYYFLAKDYGHADVLDDGIEYWFGRLISKCGKGSKDLMIRACGGIIVAFLKAKLNGEMEDLKTIGEDPGVAPIKLDPVIFVPV